MCFWIYAHTITQSGIKRAMFKRGRYEKAGPQVGKFIDRGLSGTLNKAGAWTGAGTGSGKKTPHPRPLTGTGNCGRGRPFSGPQRPCNQHKGKQITSLSSLDETISANEIVCFLFPLNLQTEHSRHLLKYNYCNNPIVEHVCNRQRPSFLA